MNYTNRTTLFELKPIFDSRKSFYRKAYVETTYTYEDNVLIRKLIKLYSYETLVAEAVINFISGINSLRYYPKADYSRTTIRHVKEFTRQTIGQEISTSELREMLYS